jgi:hypothetical protein
MVTIFRHKYMLVVLNEDEIDKCNLISNIKTSILF